MSQFSSFNEETCCLGQEEYDRYFGSGGAVQTMLSATSVAVPGAAALSDLTSQQITNSLPEEATCEIECEVE